MTTATAPTPASAPARERRTDGLGRVVASEWLKLRSVRSTYYYLAATLVATGLGTVVSSLMVGDFDTASAEDRAHFGVADPGMLALPITQLCVAALGAMAVTSEYGNGAMRTSLTAVPVRGRILAAKSIVVAAVSLATGLVVTLLCYLGGAAVVGDRHGAIRAWESFGDAVPTIAANTATMGVLGLVGVGLGLVMRATAGALVTLTAVLFIAPIAVQFFPQKWSHRVHDTLLSELPGQLAGSRLDPLYSRWGAAAVMAAYVVAVVGAGWIVLRRRDA